MTIRKRFYSIWPWLWLLGLAAVSLFLLAATLVHHNLDIEPLAHLALTYENNFGAWWSGALLLLAAMHAFDGFRLWRNERPRVARGWAVLSLVLLILSLDEIGSLHERVELWLPGSVWMDLLPFGLVLVGLFAFAILSIWSSPEHRRRALLIVLAFLCFGATAFQEYLEHNTEWGTRVNEGLRAGVEEGTELLGMLLVIGATLPNTQGIFKRDSSPASPALDAPFSWRRYAIPGALLLAPILAYVSVRWLQDHRGHPANWLASALFLLAAAAALHPFLKMEERPSMWHWVLAGSALLASALSTGLNNALPYILTVLSLVIVGAWLLVPSTLGMRRRLLFAGGLLATALVLLVTRTPFMLELVPVLSGAIVYGATTVLVERRASTLVKLAVPG